jgi:hypothetical protein
MVLSAEMGRGGSSQRIMAPEPRGWTLALMIPHDEPWLVHNMWYLLAMSARGTTR